MPTAMPVILMKMACMSAHGLNALLAATCDHKCQSPARRCGAYNFDVEIIDVRHATAEAIAQGHVH